MAEAILFERHICLITESADKDYDEIDEPSKAEHTTGEQPYNTRANFPYIEPMDAKPAKEETAQQSYNLAFVRVVASSAVVISVLIDIGVCVVVIDDHLRLLGLLHFQLTNLLAALGADDAISVDRFTAVLAEFCVSL